MEINSLNKKDLTCLKKDIELRLKDLEYSTEMGKKFKSKNLECLGKLGKNDSIFCIMISGGKLVDMDYVKITFNGTDDSLYTNYTTSHDNKPMGCSSSLLTDELHKHYFLSEFCGNFRFFTLKPEKIKDDLKLSLKKFENIEKKRYIKEVDKKVNDLNKFLDKIDDLDINNY